MSYVKLCTLPFDDSAYDCVKGEIIDEIKNIGFKCVKDGNKDYHVDNKKCWYFYDENPMTNMYSMTYDKSHNKYIVTQMGKADVDINAKDLSKCGRDKNNVFAADSIINRKIYSFAMS